MALSLQAHRLYRFEPHALYLYTTHIAGDIFKPTHIEGLVLDPGTLGMPPNTPAGTLAIVSIRRPVVSDFTVIRPSSLSPQAARSYATIKATPEFGASRDAGLTPASVRKNLAAQGIPFLGDKPTNPNDRHGVAESFRQMIAQAFGIPLANIHVETDEAGNAAAKLHTSTVPFNGDIGFASEGTQRWDGYPFPAADFRLDDKDHGLHKLYRNSADELCVLLEFQSGPDMGNGRAFGRRKHNNRQWQAHSWDVLHHDLRVVTGVEMTEGSIYKFPDGTFGRVPVGARRQIVDGKKCVEVHEWHDNEWVSTPFIWIAVGDTDNFMQKASASEALHINKVVPDPIKSPAPAIGSLWKRHRNGYGTTSQSRLYKVLDVAEGRVYMRYYNTRAGKEVLPRGSMSLSLDAFVSDFYPAAKTG